jgi:hypothetical protein
MASQLALYRRQSACFILTGRHAEPGAERTVLMSIELALIEFSGSPGGGVYSDPVRRPE